MVLLHHYITHQGTHTHALLAAPQHHAVSNLRHETTSFHFHNSKIVLQTNIVIIRKYVCTCPYHNSKFLHLYSLTWAHIHTIVSRLYTHSHAQDIVALATHRLLSPLPLQLHRGPQEAWSAAGDRSGLLGGCLHKASHSEHII